MTAMAATLSGRIRTGGPVVATEVPAQLWDRMRELKRCWGFSWDDIVTMATDAGRLPLTEETVRMLLGEMERDAEDMGAKSSRT